MKDYKEILQKYKFTDELGHPLENCQDYLDLLAETRKAAQPAPETNCKCSHSFQFHVGGEDLRCVLCFCTRFSEVCK